MRWGDLSANADLTEVMASLHSHDSEYVQLADTRLSDARTPLPHSHAQSDITGLTASIIAKENALGNPQSDGQVLSSTTAGVRSWITPQGGGGSWTRVVLSADRTNNNVVANTLADVTGLSFPVVAGQRYWFKFRIIYTAQATTTGSRWSINGPAVTGLVYMSEYSLTATTTTRNPTLTTFNLPTAGNATSAATGLSNYAEIEGFIQPSANGNVIARFASEVASSAIVAKAGSFVEYTTT